ncbi:hypothetical protein HU200_021155 [Digitaria exilis]|uniref:Peroxidase 1 n=1 Tax=Digitaria exilis TaxID=1010633 RepID=A0A835EZW8_9POAL|nr:hypothetical protein HU200_021155 [Digitaria exilis]
MAASMGGCLVLLISCFLLAGVGHGHPWGGLFPQFYDHSCPQAKEIVRSVVAQAVSRETRMAASLVRLHFHDCFVQGCDASLLLDNSTGIVSEKGSNPNRNSARGFEVVDEIKAALEHACPNTVSCADILALAARDSTVLAGGPNWDVPLGRRDSLGASIQSSNNDIPAPNNTLPTIVAKFRRQGLDVVDVVALSGAHTIGFSRCTSFRQRLYNQSGNGMADATLDASYAAYLRQGCPRSGGDDNLFPLDLVTSARFDNFYFKNILAGKGLLSSDEVLLTKSAETAALVKAYAADAELFFRHFAESMVKMGNVSPLTGAQGEHVLSCLSSYNKKSPVDEWTSPPWFGDRLIACGVGPRGDGFVGVGAGAPALQDRGEGEELRAFRDCHFSPSLVFQSRLEAAVSRSHHTLQLERMFQSAQFTNEVSQAANGSQMSKEEYCLKHNINIVGDKVPAPFMTFQSTGFPSEILREVLQAGFSAPTPIQALSWPIALKGRDLIAVAKTGALKGPQLRELDRGVDIVVATPGRLNDILEIDRVSLRQVSYLVLDEADRMLDMGFEPQIRTILKQMPPKRQTLVYTATWPKELRQIASNLLVNDNRIRVTIGSINQLVIKKSVTQHVEVISHMEKSRRLDQILRSQEPGSKMLIFCATTRMCDELARNLYWQYGDKSQEERDSVVVVNYDFPTGVEAYVHRIGRTGRAGATGSAYTFFCDQDSKYASDLVSILVGANQYVPPQLKEMALYERYGGGRPHLWASSNESYDYGSIRLNDNINNSTFGNQAGGGSSFHSSSQFGDTPSFHDEDDDGTPKSPMSTSSKKRGSNTTDTATSSPKKHKGPMVKCMKGLIDTIQSGNIKEVDVATQMQEHITNLKKEEKRLEEQQMEQEIERCMELVKECGATEETEEFYVATMLFAQKYNRTVFSKLTTNAGRMAWLKRCSRDWRA